MVTTLFEVMSAYNLPTELWIEVFRWAVVPPTDCDPYAIEYAPFQGPDGADQSAQRVKSALVLVCRLWRALTVELLYRDVVISPQAAPALRHVLEDTNAVESEHGYGKWVRRMVLPYSTTVTETNRPLNSNEILKHCPQLQILVRPRYPTTSYLCFEFEAGAVPELASLKRLDWWHHVDAERSGGINSLTDVLLHAPNLEYLLIGGVVGMSHTGYVPGGLCLPQLHTLRLNVINALLAHQIVSRWTLPALTHLVLDAPLVGHSLETFWERFGPQLRSVEFGRNVRFLQSDLITPCLRACTGMSQFNYHVFFAAPPQERVRHDTVDTLSLHAAANMMFSDAETVWRHLDAHVSFVTDQEVFPELRHIVLFGPWKGILSNVGFKPMWEKFSARGCPVEFSGVQIIP